jgi:5'-nucleotidase
MSQPHILLTNDDGVDAPGLLALARSLRQLGRITVFAPHRNWSASGHVKTMHRPLRVWDHELRDGTIALVSDGAPSDCVALALLGLIETPIDLVVSGINPHANVGHDLTYSSTVMAAMEAVISGVPGYSISLDSPASHQGELEYNPAAEVAQRIIRQFNQNGLPSGVMLNINIPYGPVTSMQGLAITRQGTRVYRDQLERRIDPRGRQYFWIGGDPPVGILEEGTDYWALGEGYVSVTPLCLDLTAQDEFVSLQALGFSL